MENTEAQRVFHFYAIESALKSRSGQEVIEIDRHVSSRSIAQELKFDHKTFLNHLRKVGFKNKFDVWVQHQLTPKNMMDQISICETLAKRNEIERNLKRMVTEDEK
ncbi:histone-lysine N-methyltransferase SETMAR [Trichonephila clavipes]|nr:histone-lysine N-methyltransferase SETMAR [Trichonephila clavipes]